MNRSRCILDKPKGLIEGLLFFLSLGDELYQNMLVFCIQAHANQFRTLLLIHKVNLAFRFKMPYHLILI
jgi:hypothetical protein